jgi:hypothetical protein
MYEDLEQIANLKFGKEMESISNQTREKVMEMQNEYAALTGSSGVRSGQHEASIGRTQIDGAEQLVRALSQIWLDLITRQKGQVSRADVPFIANKVDSYARTQKTNLNATFKQQRMGAIIGVLTEEAEMRMHAVAAELRRDLEIKVREQEAFPNQSGQDKQQPQTREFEKEGKPTRHTARVLNILIASPSDVGEERQVVEKAIHDWNATHFSNLGIMLHPVKWESHAYPASGDRPQAIINKQIVESGDILIAIFGYKLGTPTGAAQSGTIEEIEEFRKAGKYVALYFSTANVPRNADRTQLEALESYKKDRQRDTLYFEFENAPSLRDHLTRHLPKIVHEVCEKLDQSSSSSQNLIVESSGQSKDPKAQRRHATAHSPTLVADIISELEDNLDCASRPRTGDVYRRPSTSVWRENRNIIALPPDITSELKTTYNRIRSWEDVVASGLNPNLGSMELNLIVSDLRTSLPPLIDRLRKLEIPSPGSDSALEQRSAATVGISSAARRRSLDALPDLNPKEIELVVLAARDKSGQICHRTAIGHEQLFIGDHTFLDSDNPRSRAEWIGAVENLVSLGLLEVVAQKGEFYRLTDSGYAAADLLSDFARWSTNQVTIEAHFLNASAESMTIACSGILQLPPVYYQYRVRSDTDMMRSEKEPRSLIIEGVDLGLLNKTSWQPTEISFAVSGTNEAKSFLVERTEDHTVARFYVKGESA